MAEKKKPQRKGLGKGLGALFSDDPVSNGDTEVDILREIENAGTDTDGKSIIEIKVVDIEPNKDQPRKNFDKDKLAALSDSIREHGVVQPILVKPTDNGTYMIIAGERRWRAAKAAGLKTMPCIVKEFDERQVMEIALIENLQREDLNPIEEAEGYRQLMDTFHLTQEEVSERVGRSRSAVANALRLNNLPDGIKRLVQSEQLSQGHARALLAVEDLALQLELAQKIIEEGLSVRQTESLVNHLATAKPKKPAAKPNSMMLKYYTDVAEDLGSRLGTKVKIHEGANKGKIEIEYYSKDDLERILFEIRK